MASGKRTAEADCKPGGGGRHSLAYMGSRLRARAAKQSFLFLDGLEMFDGRLRGKVLSAVNSQLKDFSDEAKRSLWLNLSEESEGVNRTRFIIPGNAVFC